MKQNYLEVTHSPSLHGQATLNGAKNAVLVSAAALLLADGVSCLKRVPASADVLNMIALLKELGAQVTFDAQKHELTVDTTTVDRWCVPHSIMQKMRASVLVMGPLLARYGRADIALPGGCAIGARPINYHLENFARMGVEVTLDGFGIKARVQKLKPRRIVLDYPSVGATENILMAAVLTPGCTQIINAALEPEVLDLIVLLRSMGAKIDARVPAHIAIEGVAALQPTTHSVMYDRLEAGGLLIAAGMTGGRVSLPEADAYALDMLLHKLEQMGHTVIVGADGVGVELIATPEPQAVSFTTHPYPGFPTDLQAPMMAALCIAQGESVIEETVYENRLLHVTALQKMGANITVHGRTARIVGVKQLQGAAVEATDIRASCALVLAGLVATGTTQVSGIQHWLRGYEGLEDKLVRLGGQVRIMQPAGEVQKIIPPKESSYSYEE